MAGKGGPQGQGASGKERARESAAALRAEQQRRERRRGVLIQAGLAVVIVLVVVGVTVAVLQQRGEQTDTTAPAGFDSDGAVFVGAESAPVTLTLIEDFACPACQAFEAENATLLDSFAQGDQVRIEYRPIAFLDRVSTDEYSSRALNAAACVVEDDPANWAAMHQALYAAQPPEGGAGLPDEQLTQIAVQSGADEGAVSSCIEERRHDAWVEATTESVTGEDFFSGTPTVLVDGEKVEDTSEAGIRAAVEAAQSS